MLNLSFITQIGTSLRDFTFFELSRVKNSPTSLTCMQTSLRKKVQINKNNNNFCYISPVCPKASSGLICTKFGIRVPVADIINCANFFCRSVKRHRFCVGSFLPSFRTLGHQRRSRVTAS